MSSSSNIPYDKYEKFIDNFNKIRDISLKQFCLDISRFPDKEILIKQSNELKIEILEIWKYLKKNKFDIDLLSLYKEDKNFQDFCKSIDEYISKKEENVITQ